MDAIYFNAKQDDQVIKKVIYVAIGVKIDGTKEVLGLWIEANESSKYWLKNYQVFFNIHQSLEG